MPAAPAQAREAVLAARAALLSAAAAFLEVAGFPEGPFTIVLEAGGEERKIVAHERPPPTTAQRGRGLSPLEGRIIASADAVEYRSSERLAELVGVKCSDGFKAILTNLADAEILEPLSGKGYRRADGVSPA